MPGIHSRCMSGMRSTASTSESKSANAGAVTKRRARAAKAMRLLMIAVLGRSLGDPEVAFEIAELVDVDLADEIGDGQLAPLGRENDDASDFVADHVGVDLRVFAVALDLHQALPVRPELIAHAVDDRAVVGLVLGELVRLDVDPFE